MQIPQEPGFRVLLVRHGETEWSVSGRHTSRTDIHLTGRGRAQAGLLRRRLAGRTFDLVLSSPLTRALDTCRLIGLGGPVEITDDLREWDYGQYEGRRTVDIRVERPGWLLWTDGAPGGGTAEDVGRRADQVIARVRRGRKLRVAARERLQLALITNAGRRDHTPPAARSRRGGSAAGAAACRAGGGRGRSRR